MSYRVAFRTFGCKLNQLETESLADAFAQAGAFVVGGRTESSEEGREAPDRDGLPPEPARAEEASPGTELFVLNTCTVTGKAEQKARRAIRSALASNPHGVVIVTGCYAQVEAAALADLDERVVVIPGEDKAEIHWLAAFLGEEWAGHGALLDAVREWRSRRAASRSAPPSAVLSPPAGDALQPASRFDFRPESFAFHSRPSIKVQDGCDNHCSYCRVCIARGPSTSLEPRLVLERVRALEAAGAAEVVFTGVNLSQYRSEGLDFPGLLRHLLAGTSRIALRLSSYEPDRVDAAFLEVFSEARVRPHVHLAVQSGSDAVLARMGRRYCAAAVLEAADRLRGGGRDPFIGADLIAGFPGESDAGFEETLALARAAEFAWIHAFPFSARPGTKAWDMRPRVPERVSGERVAALTALARSGRASYVARQVGRNVEAVMEASGRATSENYLSLDLGSAGQGGLAGLAPRSAFRCRILAPALLGTETDATVEILP